MLQLHFRDNQNAWAMQSDGSYERIVAGKKQKRIRSQESLYRKTVKTLRELKELQQSTQSMFETHRPRE